jgi:hypothetical protein
MSSPHSHSGENLPSEQSQTLFVVESHQAALLVTFRNGKHKTKTVKFSNPHAALDWCIDHGAGMVFSRKGDPSHN